MQKKLIALAVAGMIAAPAAMAQSNVQIYGIVDAYVATGSQGDEKLRSVDAGGLAGSRLGFRGTEDLGNGLKAYFVLEYGLGNDVNAGVGTALARQQVVGLSGDFGSVGLGRQYAPGYFSLAYDAIASSGALDPRPILAGDAGLTINPSSAARWDNSVTYTGSFSGVTVRGIWSARGVELTRNAGLANEIKPGDDDAYGLSVGYANGPLSVGVFYHNISGNALGATKNQTEWLLGGSYDFGVAKVVATYQAGKSVGHVSKNDVDVWSVGAIVPVSEAGNIHVSYGQSDFDALSDGKAKSFGLAYTHKLSSRTTLYAGYNRVNNDKQTNAGFGSQVDENQNVLAVGVNHSF